MLNVRPPQKVYPSAFPHAPLTESISDRVTYNAGSSLAMVIEVADGFDALSL